MYVWVMDYVLHFFAFPSFTQSSRWSVQTHYSSFQNSLKGCDATIFVPNQVSVCSHFQVIQHQHWTLQVSFWAASRPAQRAMMPTTPALLAQTVLQLLMLVSLLLLPPRFCPCRITTITWLVFWPQRRQPRSPVLEPAVKRQAPPQKEV